MPNSKILSFKKFLLFSGSKNGLCWRSYFHPKYLFLSSNLINYSHCITSINPNWRWLKTAFFLLCSQHWTKILLVQWHSTYTKLTVIQYYVIIISKIICENGRKIIKTVIDTNNMYVAQFTIFVEESKKQTRKSMNFILT